MNDISNQRRRSGAATVFRLTVAALTGLVGLWLAWEGFELATLGGSLYYVLAGLAYVLLGILFVARSRIALPVTVLVFAATCVWAVLDTPEIGYWPLLPRLVLPAILFTFGLWTCAASLPALSTNTRRTLTGGGLTVTSALLVTLVEAFFPHGEIHHPEAMAGSEGLDVAQDDTGDNWEFFGRNANGTRFVPYTQITPQNVEKLKVAWTYHTGRRLTGAAIGVDENTPQQIGNILYSCSPENIVTAIDGDTGQRIWKFDPNARTAEHVSCRGVGYHDIYHDDSLTADDKAADPAQPCRQRLIVSTVDARLFALDAHTGTLCPGFGQDGFVDLKPQMGPTEGGKRYHPSAVPLIAGHIAVIGGWVRDIVHGEPSGVVRAYDVRNGTLVWAWDVGAPDRTGAPPEGETYTLETPNMWTVPTYDRALNLVYLPTGNGPPDYWGGDRNAVKEKFGAAVVAVDASTGKTKWVFQTVHHDVWDYDLPSQPVLQDVTNEKGEKVPALIQTTKTGNIFVLDRRTGTPITAVEERYVATSPAGQGEHLSKTQPTSIGMPLIGADPLSERSMWGVSTFDQLYCRIKFKQSAYTGPFTPPGEKPYIEWPSLLGGMNWGGVAIDESRGLMFVNDMRIPLQMTLETRENAKKFKVSTDEVPGFMGTIRPQVAGPYGGVKIDILQSPLQVPCNTPPFGTMSAIDLRTKKLVWQVPLGTVQDTGPMGIKTHMSVPLGMPTLGGPTATASGLVFFAGTQDYYLRALDAKSGKIVWQGRLPVGAVAAPLIYRSPRTGKEYVVISAGGMSHSPDIGDDIIAYALPDTAGATPGVPEGSNRK
ncbi:membrane-bound PQQ-dependent dehydrogenase, glucose/quinate/shikimate family [Acetobacter estunensis]|uniref:membrane-bound PQQ-dependent dehydrogenase, glucose/quinate/shikimate family n=1 Tax=Acetobacter estunensis TaxID=104097 RepID=UPI001C2CCCAD|nr:membrane-bound PQQ-dependent dehydrogenase, glucose/quinate/shikimate family [Acetobacter estunensis]MBV1836618.1 membrane-bound PQQ-dependent dehydrogenase, glucose/quinate/shikimate family [Acetobacter estunensis]